MTQYEPIEYCRVCNSPVHEIHSFGVVPVADKLMQHEDEEVPSSPLTLTVCYNCLHLQIRENISPELLFRSDYPYFSSRIPEVAGHFKDYFEEVIGSKEFTGESLIVEIASNDGVLLEHFKSRGMEVIGIEPSLAPTEVAKSKGITVIEQFFTNQLALDFIKMHRKRADLIIANNVLAHVPDPLDFVKGIFNLLNDDGLIIIEVPYSVEMLKNGTYDVILHQHFSYFSMHSLRFLFDSVNLHIKKLQMVDMQGGSLRLYLSKKIQSNSQAEVLLKLEISMELNSPAVYQRFSNCISENKKQINSLLNELKSKGKRIVAYGAPGKAATYLNFNGIGRDKLDYIVDISATKQGKFFPLAGLPIFSPEILKTDPPDYLLLLSWNYAESIMKQLDYLRRDFGVSFIIPFPVPHVV